MVYAELCGGWKQSWSIREWDNYVKTTDAEIIDGGKTEELVLDKEKLKKILNYIPDCDSEVQKMIDFSQKSDKKQ